LLEIGQFRKVGESKRLAGKDRLEYGVRSLPGQGDVERLLDLHEKLDQIEAIAPEILDDPVARRDPVPADA
jgi:hypothetical protein